MVVGITVLAVMGAAVGATLLQPRPGVAWALRVSSAALRLDRRTSNDGDGFR